MDREETQMPQYRVKLVADTAYCSGVHLSGAIDRSVLFHVCDQEAMLSE